MAKKKKVEPPKKPWAFVATKAIILLEGERRAANEMTRRMLRKRKRV